MTMTPRYHPILAFLLMTGCATVTPVVPAPLAPDAQGQLAAALVGQCHVTGTQKPGGDISEAEGIHWTFGPNGKFTQHISLGFGMTNDYTYRIEGRNIFTNGAFKAMRVDDWSGQTLKFFLYDITQTYHCTKE